VSKIHDYAYLPARVARSLCAFFFNTSENANIASLFSTALSNSGYLSFLAIPRCVGDNDATRFKLVDCLMSGLAMVGLKYASLLQFDQDSLEDERIRHKLKQLYGIKEAPSDKQFRARRDINSSITLDMANRTSASSWST